MFELPEGVDSAMFLRDGWPHCCVCKVTMKNGCVGIGVYRWMAMDGPPSPAKFDEKALADAMKHVAPESPDYTELHEHAAKMAAIAVHRSEMAKAARQAAEETDHDLQASLGQKAYD